MPTKPFQPTLYLDDGVFKSHFFEYSTERLKKGRQFCWFCRSGLIFNERGQIACCWRIPIHLYEIFQQIRTKKQKEVGYKLLAWIKTRLWDCPQCSLKCKAGKMAGGADLPELMHLGTLASLGLWDSGRASIQAEVCFENFRLGLIWGQCFDP